MKYDFQKSVRESEIDEFVDNFCHFVFQEDSNCLDKICMKCWQTLNQFGEFCDKIRHIHQSLIEVSRAPGKEANFDEQTDILDDDVDAETEIEADEDPFGTLDDDKQDSLRLLSIESDLGNEGDSFDRTMSMTPEIVKNLAKKLKFEAQTIESFEMKYDRMARFIAMRCCICHIAFDTLEMCDEHYLTEHGRSAYWNCCNLLLDTTKGCWLDTSRFV